MKAWGLLCSHYSSAVGTFTGHVKKLLGFKPVTHGDDKGLREGLGMLEASLEGALEVATPQGFPDALAAFILESMLDHKTRDQFRMDRIGVEGVPTREGDELGNMEGGTSRTRESSRYFDDGRHSGRGNPQRE